MCSIHLYLSGVFKMWSYTLTDSKRNEYMLNVYYDHFELYDSDMRSLAGGTIDSIPDGEAPLKYICEQYSLKKAEHTKYTPPQKLKNA